MDKTTLLNQIIFKTQSRKLIWESTAKSNELIAAFGGDYVLRVSGRISRKPALSVVTAAIANLNAIVEQPLCLTLETSAGQVIVGVDADESEGAYATLLGELWEMIRCGGKSAREALDDAITQLESL